MHSFCLITFVGCNILSSNAFSPISAASSSTSKSKYIPSRNFNIQTALHEKPTTIQDESVESPASLVFYDDVLDDSIPLGVVCARGVCVIDESIFETQDGQQPPQDQGLVDTVLNSYWGPRLLLAFASILSAGGISLSIFNTL
mmetsp:Transcript_41033/g.47958  ORF Transcript_41033/g.47958 Transcript_41033/m.47958 type:complete len:143 (+) Transcript_41033:62-490(+)